MWSVREVFWLNSKAIVSTVDLTIITGVGTHVLSGAFVDGIARIELEGWVVGVNVELDAGAVNWFALDRYDRLGGVAHALDHKAVVVAVGELHILVIGKVID